MYRPAAFPLRPLSPPSVSPVGRTNFSLRLPLLNRILTFYP
mgnify:FL=1